MCFFSRSAGGSGRLRVATGPPPLRRLRSVALAALHQDAAESGGGCACGDGQSLPSTAAPPGRCAPQPHRHNATVCAATQLIGKLKKQLFFFFFTDLEPPSVCVCRSGQTQTEGRVGASEDGAGRDH